MVNDKDLEAVGKAMATHPKVTKDGSCPHCGKMLKVGDWPWCPHGKGQGGFKLLGQGWTPRG